VGITFTLEKANRDLTGKLDELRVKAGLVDFLDRKFLVNEGINKSLINIIEENKIKVENRKLRGLKILSEFSKNAALPLTLEDGSRVHCDFIDINNQGVVFFRINNQDFGTMNFQDMINFMNKYDPDKKFSKRDLDNLFKKDAYVDISNNEALFKKFGLSDKLIDSISGWGIRLDSSTMGGLQALDDLFSGRIEKIVWPGQDYRPSSLILTGDIQENGQISILYNGEQKKWSVKEVVSLLTNIKKRYGITDDPSGFPGRPVNMEEVRQMEHYADPVKGFAIDLHMKREKVKESDRMFELSEEAIDFFKRSVKLDVMPAKRLKVFKGLANSEGIDNHRNLMKEMYFSEKNPGNRKKMRSYLKKYMNIDPEPEKALSYRLKANWKQAMDNVKESIAEVKKQAKEKKKKKASNVKSSVVDATQLADSELAEKSETKKKQRINRGKKRKKKK